MLLSSISPRAAKVYLALSTLAPDDPPVARFHLAPLAKRLNFSPRTCAYALRELQALQLITRLPNRQSQIGNRQSRAPSAYRLQPFPYTHPAACLSSNLQPVAVPTPPPLQPVAPTPTPNLQPVAAPANAPPISTPKTHHLQPAAPINPNPAIQPPSRPSQELSTRHPALRSPALQSLIKTLSDTEKSAMLAHLHPLLGTLSKLTALGTIPEATP